ncbi:MAG: hypothetical protein K2Q18_16140 [Bdellovibrionales bacterium]|nr:hypothetical protein [Bdellovibrionales bacterium]
MKFFFLLITSLIAISGAQNVLAQTKIAEFEEYEIRSYDPQKNGLTDLVFEARIDNLTEILSKTQTFGKLADVYYKIYWMKPDQYRIEVLGIPKGFEEVREDLSMLIRGKLEFIIPQKFSDRYKPYTLKVEPIADGKLIKAIDDTYTLAIPQVDLVFDSSGKLKSTETKSPPGPVKTEFTQTPKAWSNNKLVIDKIVSISKVGSASTTITNAIDYAAFSGVGLPTKITVKTVNEGIIPATKKEKEKKVKNESGTTIRFTKYEVNTGKAQRFITEGLRR